MRLHRVEKPSRSTGAKAKALFHRNLKVLLENILVWAMIGRLTSATDYQRNMVAADELEHFASKGDPGVTATGSLLRSEEAATGLERCR